MIVERGKIMNVTQKSSLPMPCFAMQEDKTKGWLFHWVHKKYSFESEEMALNLHLVKRNKNEDVTSPFKRASSIINCLCNIFQRFIRGSKELSWKKHNCHLDTGKSLSEALLFAEHGENMLCTKIVLNVRNNFCTQHVLPRFELGIFMYWTCDSMNNLSSYCGLVDAKIRTSDKDLPLKARRSM